MFSAYLHYFQAKSKIILPGPKAPQIQVSVPGRYKIAFLDCIAVAIVYGLRLNWCFNMDILLKIVGNNDDFDKVRVQENIKLRFATYFWGYFLGQLPGAHLAEIYSAKYVVVGTVTLSIVETVLTPLESSLSNVNFVILHFLGGAGEGALYPASFALLSRWAPPHERTNLCSIVFSGVGLGMSITFFLHNFMITEHNWYMYAYLLGGISSIWLLFWNIFVTDIPEKVSYLNRGQNLMLSYEDIREKFPRQKRQLPVPWKSIFTSTPFWTLFAIVFVINWGWLWYNVNTFITVFTKVPKHYLIVFPYISMFFCGSIFSLFRTNSNNRNGLTFVTIFVPIICYLLIKNMAAKHFEITLLLLSIGQGTFGVGIGGILANHIDLAPHLAGTLFAITNSITTFINFTTIALLMSSTSSLLKYLHWVTLIMAIIGSVFYYLHGSVELLKWYKFYATMNDGNKIPDVVIDKNNKATRMENI